MVILQNSFHLCLSYECVYKNVSQPFLSRFFFNSNEPLYKSINVFQKDHSPASFTILDVLNVCTFINSNTISVIFWDISQCNEKILYINKIHWAVFLQTCSTTECIEVCL